ncbi:hypothetical protein D3C78_1034870 [compost metagenome]
MAQGFLFRAGGAERTVQRTICQMNGNTHVGGDAQRFCRIAICPVSCHVITVKTTALNSPFAQCLSPGDAQPFRDMHLFTVAGIKNVLQTCVDIDFCEIGRFHFGDNLKHFQQLTYQAFE